MKKMLLTILLIATINICFFGKDLKIDRSIYDRLSDHDKAWYLNSLKAAGDGKYYQDRYPYLPLDIYLENTYNPLGSSSEIFVIVDKSLYEDSDFSPLFDRYALDLAYQGYSSYVYIMNAGNPAELRNWIIARSSNLKGIVFIGDLAVAFYQHNNDHNWHNYTEWPSDLFFGDLNGSYTDTNGDGIFDVFTGDIAPEIWVSRISLGQLEDRHYWTDSSFTKKTQTINLFNNIHNYFRGILKYGNRAANLIGPDWSSSINGRNRYTAVYGSNTDLFVDDEFTTIRYADCMNDIRNESAYIETHSNAHQHIIADSALWDTSVLNNIVTNGNSDGSLYNFTINQIFFGLDACSACQFTYLDNDCCIGITYLMAKYTKAQSIYGMTKTAGMNNNWILFDYLGKGDYLGDAFVKWYRDCYDKYKYYSNYYFDCYWMSWYGGSILLGNPLIKLNRLLPRYTPNTPPLLSINNSSYTVREGSELKITLPTKDYDGDSVIYALNTQIPNASIAGNVFTWTPSYTQGGITYTLSLIANDGYEEADNHLIVTVQNVKTINK